MSIFHAYDIRGLYERELDEGIAYLIGRAIVQHLNAETVLVGKDMRTSSNPLSDALVRGLRDQGASVVHIGLCSTPMFYWATQEYPAGVMVTASHNPSEYNGFKICKNGAIPVGEQSGLREIENLVLASDFEQPAERGSYEEKDVLQDYIRFNLDHLKTQRAFKIVVDAANGMGGYTYRQLQAELPNSIKMVPMFFELDGTFPNHEANPLKPETLRQLQEMVVEEGADLGVALDGDGDRVMFVDENGQAVQSDITTALIAKQILKERPGSTVLYDIRSSRVCPEEIENAGGTPVMTRVGHAFIKLEMAKQNAAFGGEISGHYYNQEVQNCENTQLVLFRLLNLLDSEDTQLSQLAAPLQRYNKIPETNFSVEDKLKVIHTLKERYGSQEGAKISTLDGIRIDFPDWWFNVRPSNTEPLLRLNLEAKSEEMMREKLTELSDEIKLQE